MVPYNILCNVEGCLTRFAAHLAAGISLVGELLLCPGSVMVHDQRHASFMNVLEYFRRYQFINYLNSRDEDAAW